MRLYLLAGRRVERACAISVQYLGAKTEQDIGCALDKHPRLSAITVKGGHEFVRGIERDFGQPGQCAGDFVMKHAALVRQYQQGRLHRITDDLAIGDFAVIATDQRQQ